MHVMNCTLAQLTKTNVVYGSGDKILQLLFLVVHNEHSDHLGLFFVIFKLHNKIHAVLLVRPSGTIRCLLKRSIECLHHAVKFWSTLCPSLELEQISFKRFGLSKVRSSPLHDSDQGKVDTGIRWSTQRQKVNENKIAAVPGGVANPCPSGFHTNINVRWVFPPLVTLVHLVRRRCERQTVPQRWVCTSLQSVFSFSPHRTTSRERLRLWPGDPGWPSGPR